MKGGGGMSAPRRLRPALQRAAGQYAASRMQLSRSSRITAVKGRCRAQDIALKAVGAHQPALILEQLLAARGPQGCDKKNAPLQHLPQNIPKQRGQAAGKRRRGEEERREGGRRTPTSLDGCTVALIDRPLKEGEANPPAASLRI